MIILARTLLPCLLLLSCEARRARVPDWVQSAPATTVLAMSCASDSVVSDSRFQGFLERFPPAQRALADFQGRVRLDRQGPGRVTVYLSNAAPSGNPSHGPVQPVEFLIQLSGFRDPGRLQVAIADAFPSAGTLPMDNRDFPLFVVLDHAPYRIRAMADGEGRIWLGDLGSLARLSFGSLFNWGRLAASSDWIRGAAPIQGFMRPPGLLQGAGHDQPGELARDLPEGIETLAWGVTPGTGPGPLAQNGFELVLTGSTAAILAVAPWLQRLVDTTAAMQGASAQTPEILQEGRRIALRCTLSREQLNVAMAMLNLPQ